MVKLMGTTIMIILAASLSSTLAYKKFESEHYIIIMPKSDVKKAARDIDAERAKAKHQARVKPIKVQ